MTHLFDGLRVVDLTSGMAGPMAAMLLADNGADVIKIEAPGGDWARTLAGFQMWNRGKRGVVLDLELGEDIAKARAMIRESDVVIEDLGSRLAAELRYESAAQLNPGLVYCSIGGYDAAGLLEPEQLIEGVIAARSGRMMGLDMLSGTPAFTPRDEPIFLASAIGSECTAALALQGISAALLERAQTGSGLHVETSLIDGLAAGTMRLPYKRRGKDVVRNDRSGSAEMMWRGIALTFMTAECADGRFLLMCARQDHHFRNWLEVTGLAEVGAQPRYARAPLHFESEADLLELEQLLRDAMKTRTQTEWMKLFTSEFDVGADPVLTVEEFLEHPQLAANNQIVKIQTSDHGVTTQLGPLVQSPGFSPSIGVPAPRLGEHQSLLDELVVDVNHEGAVANPKLPLAKGSLPFSGVTVLELAFFLAGPFGATLVAENGARVIKVESADGDPFRRVGLEYLFVAHGKESIAIDLKSADGRAILNRLVAQADVVVHSFRPGVVERLGADYETLKAINPKLVYVYATSYGSRGDESGRPAFHSSPHALSGAAILQAGEGNAPVDDSYGDPCGAVAVAAAIAMGLYGREKYGVGQYLETSMLCSTGYVHSNEAIDYPGRPGRAVVDAEQRGIHALYRLYKCAEGQLFIGLVGDGHWPVLCDALGHQEWQSDPRFATEGARAEHDSELAALIGDALSVRSAVAWDDTLSSYGIPVARADAARFEEFLVKHGILEPADNDVFGEYFRLRPRIRFSNADSKRGRAVSAGQNTSEILAELGYSPDECASLMASGAAFQRGL